MLTVEHLKSISQDYPIVFYDGVCNLCNGFVQMVIRNDAKGKVRFCALQDEAGSSIREYLSQKHDISTAIGLHKGKFYTHSDVLWMVAITLGGLWQLLRPFYVLPKSFRDRIYNWVANNRYKWFGKVDSCMVPSPELLDRFITANKV